MKNATPFAGVSNNAENDLSIAQQVPGKENEVRQSESVVNGEISDCV